MTSLALPSSCESRGSREEKAVTRACPSQQPEQTEPVGLDADSIHSSSPNTLVVSAGSRDWRVWLSMTPAKGISGQED